MRTLRSAWSRISSRARWPCSWRTKPFSTVATGRFRGIPTLGVTVTNSPDNGGQVVVYTVEDGYGAAEAGIQPGDVLLKADGQPLHQINDLMAVRRTHLVDDTMTLTVLRDGQVFDVEVPLYANKG